MPKTTIMTTVIEKANFCDVPDMGVFSYRRKGPKFVKISDFDAVCDAINKDGYHTFPEWAVAHLEPGQKVFYIVKEEAEFDTAEIAEIAEKMLDALTPFPDCDDLSHGFPEGLHELD